MKKTHYLYNVNYTEFEVDLCGVEMFALFKEEMSSKVFSSPIKVEPSISPYIKNRISLYVESESFEGLLQAIEFDERLTFGRKIEYIKLSDDDVKVKDKKYYYRLIAECLYKKSSTTEYPEYYTKVSDLYGLTHYEDKWYFGPLVQNTNKWKNHNKRPHTYSNSLKINMAKALVNILGQGDLERRLIDPLCGAGTVLLEAAFAGYNMVGSDMNDKVVANCLENLTYFDYNLEVKTMPIESIDTFYDGVLIDLPYDLFTLSSKESQLSILKAAQQLGKRVVVVSSEDISDMLTVAGLSLRASCKVRKNFKKAFARYVWVCESNQNKTVR